MNQGNTAIAKKTMLDTLSILGTDANGTRVEIRFEDILRASGLTHYHCDTMLDTLTTVGALVTLRNGDEMPTHNIRFPGDTVVVGNLL
jgi:hypothetical protein